MNGGPIGNGLSYWANIKISGTLTAVQLKNLTDKIEALIRAPAPGVTGQIVTQARVTDTDGTAQFQVAYRK